MKVTFDLAARDELDSIFAWIAKDSPRAASELIARIEAKVMRLEVPELAQMGRSVSSKERADCSDGRTSSSTRCSRIETKLLSCRSYTARGIARTKPLIR